jgi:hypothetical protein
VVCELASGRLNEGSGLICAPTPRRIRRNSLRPLTMGITDLMTSLAVIFILLFSAYVTKVSETESQAKVPVTHSGAGAEGGPDDDG